LRVSAETDPKNSRALSAEEKAASAVVPSPVRGRAGLARVGGAACGDVVARRGEERSSSVPEASPLLDRSGAAVLLAAAPDLPERLERLEPAAEPEPALELAPEPEPELGRGTKPADPSAVEISSAPLSPATGSDTMRVTSS